MAFILTLKRVADGAIHSANVVPRNTPTASGAAPVHAALARYPDNISVVMNRPSEAQLQGLLKYGLAIANGEVTTSIEGEIELLVT